MSGSARRPISGGQPSPLPAEARRAPTEAEWAALDEAQRRQVEEELWESDSVEQQEAEYKEAMAESERHLDAKVEARDTLREFFRQQRPNLFIAAELPVYYPGQKPIRPDLIAVVDVDPYPRDGWLVTREGKGIDFALEIRYKGDWNKDFVHNVSAYAALGIQEYFAFDILRRDLRGYRLRARGGGYQPIRGPWGRLRSEVLGLDLVTEGSELRFLLGNAELLGGTRLLRKLESLYSDAAERAEAEAQRAEVEAQRAEAMRAALAQGVLTLLGQRNLPLTREQEERVRDCQEVALLGRWLSRAPAVASGDELFQDDVAQK